MKLALFVLSLSALAMAAETRDVTPTPETDRAFCNVSMLGSSKVTGGRCRFFDEVMTGIASLDPLTIRCSRVNVTCNRNGKPVEVTMEKEEAVDERN